MSYEKCILEGMFEYSVLKASLNTVFKEGMFEYCILRKVCLNNVF